MEDADFKCTTYKFSSAHRDDIYSVLGKDFGELFGNRSQTFLAAFMLGYRLDGRKRPKDEGKPINHVNMTSFDDLEVDLMIFLMRRRHPELSSADDLWEIVEEYAEYGIVALYNGVRNADGEVDIDRILGRK